MVREIKLEGFTTNIRSTVDLSLVIGVFGIQGSGKTRFCATAPDPIGVVPLDRKTRYSVAKTMEELGKTVVMPNADFIRHENPLALATMDMPKAMAYYKEHVKRVMDAAFKLNSHKDIRTVVIDTGTQLWEDIMFKNYGRNQRIMPRDRGAANQDMIDFLNAMSGKHLILTHKASEVWAGDGDNSKPTGKYKASGFGHLGYHSTCVIELKKNTLYDTEKGSGGGKSWKYSMDVTDCQGQPELEGPQGKDVLTDESISFANLAMMIYPDQAEEFV